MSSGSTVVSTQRSQGNCIFLNIKWNLLKGYLFTNHWSFCLMLGSGEGGIVFLFVSLAIFFPLFPSIDQVWLVHFLGAISSSLIPRLGSPWCLRNTSPLKGKIPCFLEVKFCSSCRSYCLSFTWNCVSQIAASICCLRPAK